MMDHLTRFAVLLPVRDKAADTVVARPIIERIISILGRPETLHSDQGPEFENKVIYQLQQILGYKKTRTTPYRPQGNSVSERVHSTMHNMLAMHSAIDQSNWASLLPFVQLAPNTSFSTTMHETPFFSMFGRQPRLPVDIILGIPHDMYQVCRKNSRYRRICTKHTGQFADHFRTRTPKSCRACRQTSRK